MKRMVVGMIGLIAVGSGTLYGASAQFNDTHFVFFPPQFTPRQLETIRKEYEQSRKAPQKVAKQEPLGTRQVLFSPDDDLSGALVDLITQEQKSIKIAVYTFTDQDIAQALMQAHQRGVEVVIVTDPSYRQCSYSKIPQLKKAGITIFEYDPQHGGKQVHNLMHHKFAVFGDSCVWTGSFNFTKSARHSNQENVVVITQADAVKRFLHQFERVKDHRCVGCKKKEAVLAHSTRGKVKKNKEMIRVTA